MKASSHRCATALAALMTTAGASLIGGGIASAGDPLVGMNWADASAQITKWKMHPVFSTVVGDVVALDKCIVTSWRRDLKAAKVFLALDCNEQVATATSPGRSAATPTGSAIKKHNAIVQELRAHPELCLKLRDQQPDLFKGDKRPEGCEDTA
ncbi:hypothetical protein [Mycolicibacterium mucogenicum]|uniref:hypothetical protein n=1 Tax=Mycolicibacterium mucogenicum TaxID=56689 RepID=UPI0010427F9F|nr:hypothetical protein [Mycolicibacterium mucogenicum]